MTRHKKRGLKLRSLHTWHRYLGVVAALFVLVLTLTGIVLNHTDQLKLASRSIESSWLLTWYGIEAPENVIAYESADNWVSQWGGRMYFNDRELGKFEATLVGVAGLQDYFAVALTNQILLVMPDGQLVEALSGAHGVPSELRGIGISHTGKAVLKAANGFYLADRELLEWKQTDPSNVTWSEQSQLPEALSSAIAGQYRGSKLPLERVLLDLHSGRILGSWGIYVMDAAAILLTFLAGSGLWIWSVRSIQNKRHRQRSEAKRRRKLKCDTADVKSSPQEGATGIGFNSAKVND